MNSALEEYKNKSANKGAQLIPIGIGIIFVEGKIPSRTCNADALHSERLIFKRI
jgi:hypothetical protein